MDKNEILNKLNVSDSGSRLKNLESLIKEGALDGVSDEGFVNNHIHTIYSFSPYSPSAAVFMAKQAGLSTAGIMDHDSVGGAREFIRAGEIAGMPVTCGFECRVTVKGTALDGRRINNPDQLSVAYVALHGIPHQNIEKCEDFLRPYREKRNLRNRSMVAKLCEIFDAYGVSLDFDADVLPISCATEGGSVTERHILFALAKKLTLAFGKGEKLVAFLKNDLKASVSTKMEDLLSDPDNAVYEYDLLGVLKSEFVPKFYIDATEECPHISEFVSFAKSIGGISAYAYLGDVGDSVTGDKKTQKFEDDYLDILFPELRKLGFDAVTYMPTRNTPDQLCRIMRLCDEFGFMEICGEDINSPRQKFICPALKQPEYEHLSDSTWALIGHENEATISQENSIFSATTVKNFPNLKERIGHFKAIGMRILK